MIRRGAQALAMSVAVVTWGAVAAPESAPAGPDTAAPANAPGKAAADAPAKSPTLPDLKRGQQAAEAGDAAAAERDLVPLAEMGYVQAQSSLGSMYTRSDYPDTIRKGVHWFRLAAQQDNLYKVPLARSILKLNDPATFAEAERFLKEADKSGDPRALAALLECYTDHPELGPKTLAQLVGRAEKSSDPEVASSLMRYYRHNLQVPGNGDRLAKRCDKMKDTVPECYADLARHDRANNLAEATKALCELARKQYGKGVLPPQFVESMAWSLVEDNIPGEPEPGLAYPLLKQVMNASLSARVKVARMQVEYSFLDPNANPEKVLLDAVAQGSDEAALALGRLYLTGSRVTSDPEKARRYFEQATRSQPAAHFYLGRMYKRGELGIDDPVLAAKHLLTAARNGYFRADYLLALLFCDARGARVNRPDAYVFAALAAREGVPDAQPLLARLRASMSPGELHQAEQLVGDELAARNQSSQTASFAAAEGVP